MIRIIVTYPNNETVEFLTGEESVLIGRAPVINDICLEDPSISRQHAKLRRKKDHFVIKDLNSQNGILWKGDKVSQQELKSGEVVELGNVRMEIRRQDGVIKLQYLSEERAREDQLVRYSLAEKSMADPMVETTINRRPDVSSDSK